MSRTLQNANNNLIRSLWNYADYEQRERFNDESNKLSKQAQDRADKWVESQLEAVARSRFNDESDRATDAAMANAISKLLGNGKSDNSNVSILQALMPFLARKGNTGQIPALVAGISALQEREKTDKQTDTEKSALGNAALAYLAGLPQGSQAASVGSAAATAAPWLVPSVLNSFGFAPAKSPQITPLTTSDGKTVDVVSDANGNVRFMPQEKALSASGAKLPDEIFVGGRLIPKYISAPAKSAELGNGIVMYGGSVKTLNPEYEKALLMQSGTVPAAIAEKPAAPQPTTQEKTASALRLLGF